VASRLSILGVADLERLATALYVMQEEGDAPVAIQAQRINEIKPHIPISKAEEAIHEVKNLTQEYAAMLA